METLDLRAELVTETTAEDLTLFRVEIRDGYSNLVDCTRWTVHPATAHRAGADLLDQARSDAAFREARREAARLFAA